MTRFHPSGFLASLGVLGLLACAGGTGEGNPEFGYLSVSLRAQAAAAGANGFPTQQSAALSKVAATDTLRLFDEEKTPYTIHHIYTHIHQVEFERPKGGICRNTDSVICTDTTVTITGSRYFDLLEKPNSQILKDFPLPLGVYNRMKIRFEKLVEHGGESIPTEYRPLLGHSILMKGTFAYQGVSDRPLTILMDIDEALTFENAAGLSITTDTPHSWAGVFIASRWLQNLEITECLDNRQINLEPDGGLVISSNTECNEMKDSLLVNVRGSTFFERDAEHEDHE